MSLLASLQWPGVVFSQCLTWSVNNKQSRDSDAAAMVSRRKILSQSRDELNFRSHEEEEDTWYNKDKLYKVNCYELFFSHCDLRSDWTMRKIQLSPNPSLCEITFYCHTMANCTLNPKSRQRVHRHNYCQLCVFQISDIIVDLQCHIVTMWHLRKVVVSGEAMLHDDVWDDVMSLKRIPPGPAYQQCCLL